jgi:hypothetical protein
MCSKILRPHDYLTCPYSQAITPAGRPRFLDLFPALRFAPPGNEKCRPLGRITKDHSARNRPRPSLSSPFCLGPFEWGGVLIPTGYKSFDGFNQHAHAGEAGPLQGAAAQNAKPAFNLVKPGAVGGNKMKMYVGVGFEPAVLFWLVSVEIVQDYVEFFAGTGTGQIKDPYSRSASALIATGTSYVVPRRRSANLRHSPPENSSEVRYGANTEAA